ncbi:MAG: hypothetical protein LUF92_02700 [Clostridiales bacterium]|nr:hypothetical protein [Clostridiales bacterium]
MEAFEYGYDIAERLSILEVGAENEYTDADLFSLSELMRDHHLLTTDYKTFALEAAYVAYQGNVLADRVDAFYRMIENLQFDAFTLEQVMQHGEELPEIEEFMDLWIAYLGNISSRRAKRLLKEAVELGNNPDQLLENARKYYHIHPSLYEQYIDDNIHDIKLVRVFLI